MDLVYIPEVLTFGSFRNTQYRDYEQPWNRNDSDNGKTYQHHRQQQNNYSSTSPLTSSTSASSTSSTLSSSKDSCHLCKENKRRALAAYIRGKTRNNSCSEICEEDEEIECGKIEQQQKQLTQKKK